MRSAFLALAFLLLLNSFLHVESATFSYSAQVVPCTSCPDGNTNGLAFQLAGSNLNGSQLAPDLHVAVGDKITISLADNSANGHPLLICTGPDYCTEATPQQTLTTPITNSGETISYTATSGGTFFYGCHIHHGMGKKLIKI
jgi:plastocyanin